MIGYAIIGWLIGSLLTLGWAIAVIVLLLKILKRLPPNTVNQKRIETEVINEENPALNSISSAPDAKPRSSNEIYEDAMKRIKES